MVPKTGAVAANRIISATLLWSAILWGESCGYFSYTYARARTSPMFRRLSETHIEKVI